MLFETVGWIGGALLFICGVPLLYEAVKTGKAETFNTVMGKAFLWMWFLGELLTVIYVLSFTVMKWPLIMMGVLNVLIVAIILKYLYFPRGSE